MPIKLLTFRNGNSTGILESLFESDIYSKVFTFSATSHEQEKYHERNAFNFSSTSYWIGSPSDTPNNLTFCFKSFWVATTGYAITAAHHLTNIPALPKSWGFSGSNDRQTWEHYTPHNHTLEAGETYFVSWSYPTPFKCFKLTTIDSIRDDYTNRFDLCSIDVYGSIIWNPNTCKQLFTPFSMRFFLYQSFAFFVSQ